MSDVDTTREPLQKKLQADLEGMFDLEFQRNDLNYALSGVERGEITHQDIKEDMSLAVSKYVVLDLLPQLLDQALDDLLEAMPKKRKKDWFEEDGFCGNCDAYLEDDKYQCYCEIQNEILNKVTATIHQLKNSSRGSRE